MLRARIFYSQLVEKTFEKERIEINSSQLFESTKRLSEMVYPSVTYGNNDIRWLNLYLPVIPDMPLEPAKDVALIPFSLVFQKLIGGKRYIISLPLVLISQNSIDKNKHYILRKNVTITLRKGEERADEIYKLMLEEAANLLNRMKNSDIKLENYVPYLFRKGKVKSKYVVQPQISEDEARRILELYEKRNKGEIYPISLEDYLKVARICLRAMFPEDAHLSDKEIYRKHADFRHGGMLEIDPKDKKAFEEWYESREWEGSHPFEIVAGYSTFGISLYPPTEENKRFIISVGSVAYYLLYLKAVRALIEENIPFDAPQLEEVVNHLAGEVYIPVNEEGGINCCVGNEKFLKYVEWKELKLPKIK